METMSYTAVRKDLADTMDKVCDDHEPVVITRQTARPVVLISLEDYNAIEETAYLLRSPKNAARLMESIEEIEAGKSQEKSLIE
jgi:antitoxin YefM